MLDCDFLNEIHLASLLSIYGFESWLAYPDL